MQKKNHKILTLSCSDIVLWVYKLFHESKYEVKWIIQSDIQRFCVEGQKKFRVWIICIELSEKSQKQEILKLSCKDIARTGQCVWNYWIQEKHEHKNAQLTNTKPKSTEIRIYVFSYVQYIDFLVIKRWC